LNDAIAMIVIFYHGISIMIELRWLRSFLAVADEMHLSRAARKLHLAQPALTTQIQQLERSLGSSLFQRSNRISDLTAAGLVLLPEARAIVARAEALPGIVERAARGETGRLRLGIIPPAATNRLAECLRTISLELPDMDLTVRQGSQDDLTSELIQHGLDLVIGRPLPEKKSGLSQLHAPRQSLAFSPGQGRKQITDLLCVRPKPRQKLLKSFRDSSWKFARPDSRSVLTRAPEIGSLLISCSTRV
jgi:DNA-binding transcriptional LysR family regulator